VLAMAAKIYQQIERRWWEKWEHKINKKKRERQKKRGKERYEVCEGGLGLGCNSGRSSKTKIKVQVTY